MFAHENKFICQAFLFSSFVDIFLFLRVKIMKGMSLQVVRYNANMDQCATSDLAFPFATEVR